MSPEVRLDLMEFDHDITPLKPAVSVFPPFLLTVPFVLLRPNSFYVLAPPFASTLKKMKDMKKKMIFWEINKQDTRSVNGYNKHV